MIYPLRMPPPGIGVAQAAIELAMGWARQRRTFGALLIARNMLSRRSKE